MAIDIQPHIISAERLGLGVVVDFSDGNAALFPASFLVAHRAWYAIDVPPERDGVPSDDL